MEECSKRVICTDASFDAGPPTGRLVIADENMNPIHGLRVDLSPLQIDCAYRTELAMMHIDTQLACKSSCEKVTIFSDCLSVVKRMNDLDSTRSKAHKSSIHSYLG